eukprot:CAMPEP_0113448810 /NCGR_PEP_ID=MMETSP0014_2-20120614/4965_1 /TAXON_ID=2857 /ORGANISM="Nitzschia sp." /LENGTH=617 /DNA_ID=CAMNT_0000340047 /DNA_START=687 /DNA_END=2540 /DNA_ORIENTATION=- /assembly_acc=CAM_ASM_000159
MTKLRFADELVGDVFIVPRVEDELIDDLFYQEDEIGEMRHFAFMIECGLEEDPPDGPDVPPVPWGDMLLKQQRQQSTSNRSEFSDSSPTSVMELADDPPPERAMPERTQSADDADGLLKDHSSPSPKRRGPPERRKLVVTKSGSLHAVRPSKGPTRSPPGKSRSSDEVIAPDVHLTLSFAKTNKASDSLQSPTKTRRLVASKSGSLHGMQAAAKRNAARGRGDDDTNTEESPRRLRRMMRCKSGTTHGMRKAAEAVMAKKKAKDDADAAAAAAAADKNETGLTNEQSPRRLRKMMRCKSGTTHGMRKAAEAAMALSKSPDRPPKPSVRRARSTSSEDTPENSKADSPAKKSAAGKDDSETHIVFKNGKRTVVTKPKKQESNLSESSSSVGLDLPLDLPPRPSTRRNSNGSLRSSGSLRSNGPPTPVRRVLSPRSSFGSSTSNNDISSSSDDDFLSDLASLPGDDGSIDVSISTDGGDDLVPASPVVSSPLPSKGPTKTDKQKVIKDKKKKGTLLKSPKAKSTKDKDKTSTASKVLSHLNAAASTDSSNKSSSPKTSDGEYTLEDFEQGRVKGVDMSEWEKHLTDSEFTKHFGTSKDDFAKQPKWKQDRLKRKVRVKF